MLVAKGRGGTKKVALGWVVCWILCEQKNKASHTPMTRLFSPLPRPLAATQICLPLPVSLNLLPSSRFPGFPLSLSLPTSLRPVLYYVSQCSGTLEGEHPASALKTFHAGRSFSSAIESSGASVLLPN